MTKRLLAVGCAVIVPFVYSALGQTASPEGAAARSAAAQPPSAPAPSSPQRVLLDRYCVGCHSQRAKAAGQDSARKLTLDDLDPARVSQHPDKWELVVRKLRAGMMPPAGIAPARPGHLRVDASPGSRTSSIGRRRRTPRRPACIASIAPSTRT